MVNVGGRLVLGRRGSELGAARAALYAPSEQESSSPASGLPGLLQQMKLGLPAIGWLMAEQHSNGRPCGRQSGEGGSAGQVGATQVGDNSDHRRIALCVYLLA